MSRKALCVGGMDGLTARLVAAPQSPGFQAPDRTYTDGGWQGWVHWLGTGSIKKASKFVPFGQALAVARSRDLASAFEWRAWCNEGMRPPNVPSKPDRTYKDGGWQGWGALARHRQHQGGDRVRPAVWPSLGRGALPQPGRRNRAAHVVILKHGP